MNELIPISNASVQLQFDWDAVFAETKELVAEDAQLTSTIEEAMVRRFEVRVKIGFNLIALQEEHSKNGYGDFTTIELPKLGITDRVFAHRCIRVAKLYENPFVASLQRTNFFEQPLPMSTWNELASPSTPETVIEQVMSGEIEATPQAIREAREAQKQAEEASELIREQLWQTQKTAKAESLQLSTQIAQLKLEIEHLSAQKVSPSPAVQAELEALREKTRKLTEQRDNLSKKAEELGKEAREATLKRNEEERERQVRQEWQKLTKDFQVAVVKLMSQLPSPIDVQVFEAEDWERLSQAKELARRFIAECENLSRSPAMIIDAGWQVPYAVGS